MKCAICGKGGCKPWERNTDGTYTHATCLYANLFQPMARGLSKDAPHFRESR